MQDPVPHVSVASWVLGSGEAPVTEAGKGGGEAAAAADPFGLCRLAPQVGEDDAGAGATVLQCEEVHCKVGNRLYRFPLAPET